MDIYPHIKSNLDFVYTKGVEVDLLLEERLKDHQILTALMEDKAKEQFKIRFIPYIQLSFVISDRKEGLQGFKGNFNLAKPHKKLFSIISSDHSLYIQYLNEMFKQMWETSFS